MTHVFKEAGILVKEANYTVIKKQGKQGDRIPKHDHPEAMVLFTVVKGALDVCVGKDHFVVEETMVLSFDGLNCIEAEFLKDSEIVITLIKK